jgi:hypothetical protein
MKNKKDIEYPVCFKKVRIGPPKPYKHMTCHENEFYRDNRFAPQIFYKPIIIL